MVSIIINKEAVLGTLKEELNISIVCKCKSKIRLVQTQKDDEQGK